MGKIQSPDDSAERSNGGERRDDARLPRATTQNGAQSCALSVEGLEEAGNGVGESWFG